MNELAIDTKDLTKTYGSIRAVGGINLSVPRGAIYGFLGRNGAGKTTTIKMLLGLARPTTGAARVFGMDISDERISILQRTAFVSEKKILYPWLTPTELVRFSGGFYPTWSDSSVEKYARLLEIPCATCAKVWDEQNVQAKFGRVPSIVWMSQANQLLLHMVDTWKMSRSSFTFIDLLQEFCFFNPLGKHQQGLRSFVVEHYAHAILGAMRHVRGCFKVILISSNPNCYPLANRKPSGGN